LARGGAKKKSISPHGVFCFFSRAIKKKAWRKFQEKVAAGLFLPRPGLQFEDPLMGGPGLADQNRKTKTIRFGFFFGDPMQNGGVGGGGGGGPAPPRGGPPGFFFPGWRGGGGPRRNAPGKLTAWGISDRGARRNQTGRKNRSAKKKKNR